MSNRLGGKQGTAYLGTNANQPPNWNFEDRDPNQYDIQNVSLGDLWLNSTNESVWVLVSLQGDSDSKGSLATWTLLQAGGGSGDLNTLTGTSGGAITPDGASNINILSAVTGLTFVGNAGAHSLTLTSTGGSDDFLQTLTGNSGGAISGNLGNINIVGDGTSVNVAGNAGTNTLTVSLVGGGGAAIEEIDGDTGAAFPIGGLVALIADQAALGAGSTVSFNAAGNVITFNVTDGLANTIVGASSGNLTLTGSANTVFGSESGQSITSGSRNTIIGEESLHQLTTGNYNIVIGTTTMNTYTTSESNNIIIGNAVSGIALESNVLRIGDATGSGTGDLNQSFIHGIRGITPVGGDGIPVYVDSNGQLGTVGSGGTSLVSTLTGNSGGAVSPTAGNINIVGDGTSITIVGNPGTHTLTASVVGGGSGVLTIDGDSGTATPIAGLINLDADNAALGSGSTVSFVAGTPAANDIVFSVTDTNDNTIIGADSGRLAATGNHNTVLGQGSLAALTTGNNNTILGATSGALITTGGANTVIGRSSLNALTTGGNNVIVGAGSGSAYVSAESNNILIGTTVAGTAAETNVLRIGSATGGGAGQLTKSFIAGIRGISPTGGNGIPVYIDSSGQLGTIGTGIIATATGNSGGAVPADGVHNLNIVGDGVGVNVVGTPGTNTLTISLAGGGGGIEEIDGDSGTAIPVMGVVNIIADQAALGCGSTVAFVGSGDTLELAVTDVHNSTIIGADSGRLAATGTFNTILGYLCGTALTTGFSNTIVGSETGRLITTGSSNTLVGGDAGESITGGTTNTIVGRSSGSLLTTGSNNIILGSAAGNNYTSSESNNIIIGNSITGTALEANVLRIGNTTSTGAGGINKTFIQGIRGITPGAGDGIPVFVDSNGQLGTIGSGPIEEGPSFSVYLTNNFTYTPANSIRTIVYDTVDFDLDGNYDTSTGHFTAPISGLYNFTVAATVKCGTASSTQPQMKLYIATTSGLRLVGLLNATSFVYNSLTDTTYNGYWCISGSIYAAMDAGDIALIQSGIIANNLTGSNVTYPGTSTFGPIGGPIIPNTFGGSLVAS